MGVIFLVMRILKYIQLDRLHQILLGFMTWRVTQPIGSMTGMTLITIESHLLIIRQGLRQGVRRLGVALIFQRQTGSLQIRFGVGLITQFRRIIIQVPAFAAPFSSTRSFKRQVLPIGSPSFLG
ncbi:hypothetical protein A471_03855 [Ectopseudomonas mendocina DLHK]|nr:hypothetical protein A471_03855 [Pseudomonas mendocina DLHK]